MIDQSSQFMAILTAVGEAKQANADAMNIPWTFSQMGVGDANGADPQPNRAQTKLINERRRAPLNQVKIDPKNTNVIIAEQVIPENVGGWWIREIGLYDADGDLVAVANCAPSFKPELAQGSGKTQVVRINFIVSSAANVTLKIDPSVVLATRQYVDDRIIEVLPPTRKPGSYTKVLIDKRGVVLEGSNPETLAGNGIIDAYTKEQIDGALKLKAPLASPALTGIPTAPTAASGSNSQQLANTAFVQATVSAVISGAPGALDTLKELADALGGDPNFANTIINGLAEKANKGTTLEDYNITNGVPIRNPLAAGSLDIHGGSFAFLSANQEASACQNCYWNGTSWLRHDVSRPAVCLALERGAVVVRKAAAGSNPIIWGTSDAVIDGSSLTFAAIRNKPTTLAGFNILDAYTKVEVTTAIQAAIAGVIDGAPGALDTIRELAAALGGDPNFANTIINGLAEKAPKATTLEGYNITNGMPIRNPLGGGSLDLHGGQFAFVTSVSESSVGQNCYWNGTSWLRHDLAAAAVCVTVAAGRVVIRKAPAGANPIVWVSAPELVDTSMLASAEEAESGANIARWMNPYTVARYVAKKVMQATEYVAGIAGIASINQVNAGTDDTTMVTPKKLKWGFSFSPTQNGYFCFPSWLGGFLLQWGYVYESQGATDYRGFNVPFPSACFGMVMSIEAATQGGHASGFGYVTQVIDRTKFIWSVGGSLSGGGYGYYWAWGS